MRTLPALLLLPALIAQAPSVPDFAPPVRLMAANKGLGEDRLFPSPVLHDMNADGLPDLVVGDLTGKLTVALRLPGAGEPFYAAETKVLASDGQELRFHNW